jgi:hypothetical protein
MTRTALIAILGLALVVSVLGVPARRAGAAVCTEVQNCPPEGQFTTSVGGAEAELGCSPSSQLVLSSFDGASCLDLAHSVFEFDKSAAGCQLQLDELPAVQAAIIARLASALSELSETEALRLQMAMDRRSKFIQTLMNALAAISATQDAIVQSLK